MNEEKKYYLVEIDTNFPREMEIEAESPEEAESIAQEKIEDLNEREFPEFWANRVTESGQDKGIVWSD